ncbi:hypothetical protein B0H34DRAFT_547617 [Crassisporium funariophilum]|nr:hypothetical protein B0H34DRAFT_547617 [Crassisporium funariophilum]
MSCVNPIGRPLTVLTRPRRRLERRYSPTPLRQRVIPVSPYLDPTPPHRAYGRYCSMAAPPRRAPPPTPRHALLPVLPQDRKDGVGADTDAGEGRTSMIRSSSRGREEGSSCRGLGEVVAEAYVGGMRLRGRFGIEDWREAGGRWLLGSNTQDFVRHVQIVLSPFIQISNSSRRPKNEHHDIPAMGAIRYQRRRQSVPANSKNFDCS